MTDDTKTGPAFYAYWLDRFTAATASWTAEEVGAYQRLLNYQGQHGSIPLCTDRLARIAGMDKTAFDGIWRALLRSKFEPCPDDTTALQNPRMAEERAKALRLTGQRSDAGKASGKARRANGRSSGRSNGRSNSRSNDRRTTQTQTQNSTPNGVEKKARKRAAAPPPPPPSRHSMIRSMRPSRMSPPSGALLTSGWSKPLIRTRRPARPAREP